MGDKSKENLSAEVVQSLVYKNVHTEYDIYAGWKAYHKSTNKGQTADLQTWTQKQPWTYRKLHNHSNLSKKKVYE